MKTFDEFKEALENDKELSSKMMKKLKENKSVPGKEVNNIIIAFAKENGYEITAEDISLAMADKHELDDSELEKVTGGHEYCWGDYVCAVAWNTCFVSDECSNNGDCKGNVDDPNVFNVCESGVDYQYCGSVFELLL